MCRIARWLVQRSHDNSLGCDSRFRTEYSVAPNRATGSGRSWIAPFGLSDGYLGAIGQGLSPLAITGRPTVEATERTTP